MDVMKRFFLPFSKDKHNLEKNIEKNEKLVKEASIAKSRFDKALDELESLLLEKEPNKRVNN